MLPWLPVAAAAVGRYFIFLSLPVGLVVLCMWVLVNLGLGNTVTLRVSPCTRYLVILVRAWRDLKIAKSIEDSPSLLPPC